MPTYHYRCTACLHEFEEFQKMSDPPLGVCPACQQESLTKLIGAGAGFVFKGSGFYLTDYKKGPEKKTTGAEKGDAAGATPAPPAGSPPPAPKA